MKVDFNWFDVFLVSPLLALFFVSLIPISIKVFGGNREPNAFANSVWALMGVVAAFGLGASSFGVNKTAFSGQLIFDGISGFAIAVVSILTAITIFFAKENKANVGRLFSETLFLILNAALGMLIVAFANDLVMLFIGIEYMSLCLYILIAISNEERLSKEAAFKYFILGSFASAIMLFGIAFMFGTAGTTQISLISEAAQALVGTNRLFQFGLLMLISGLLFKVAIVPFHSWVPDVYQGSPSPIAGFMATGVKTVAFIAILRIFSTQFLMGDNTQSFSNVLQWLAVLTMMFGNIAAIRQTNLKRMLAYSGIAHSGYALVGVIAAGMGGETFRGASSLLFYLFSYSIMTAGTFGIACVLEKNENSNLRIQDLRGLASRSPALALCFTIFLLSLAGIPPTLGFFGKFFVFSAAVKQGLFWLTIWGVISSVISVYYYLRPLVLMYMSDEAGEVARPGTTISQYLIAVCALVILVLGILSNPVYEFVLAAVRGPF